MINKARRTAVKSIVAATAAAVAPTVVNAAVNQTSASHNGTTQGTDLQMSFKQRSMGQRVSIKNTSNAPITIKHVSPGIVNAGGQTYDINGTLKDKALTINANSSIEVDITPTQNGAIEQPLPSGLTQSQSFTVSTQVQTTTGTTPVTTLRSYLV